MTLPDSSDSVTGGFGAAPNWLIRDPSISTNVKMMFLVLSSYSGRTGVSFPSQETIASLMGVSVPTVKRTLAEMRALGLVEVVVAKTATGRRNHYRLLIDSLGGGRLTHDPIQEGVGSPVIPRVGSPGTQEEESLEEELLVRPAVVQGKSAQSTEGRRLEREADPVFMEFYRTYPRREAVADCYKAWKQINGAANSDCIMAGLKAQLSTLTAKTKPDKDGKIYCPLPASWLRNERWDDEITPRLGNDYADVPAEQRWHQQPGEKHSDWMQRVYGE